MGDARVWGLPGAPANIFDGVYGDPVTDIPGSPPRICAGGVRGGSTMPSNASRARAVPSLAMINECGRRRISWGWLKEEVVDPMLDVDKFLL